MDGENVDVCRHFARNWAQNETTRVVDGRCKVIYSNDSCAFTFHDKLLTVNICRTCHVLARNRGLPRFSLGDVLAFVRGVSWCGSCLRCDMSKSSTLGVLCDDCTVLLDLFRREWQWKMWALCELFGSDIGRLIGTIGVWIHDTAKK